MLADNPDVLLSVAYDDAPQLSRGMRFDGCSAPMKRERSDRLKPRVAAYVRALRCEVRNAKRYLRKLVYRDSRHEAKILKLLKFVKKKNTYC